MSSRQASTPTLLPSASFRALLLLALFSLCFSVQASHLTPQQRHHNHHERAQHLKARASKSYDITIDNTATHSIPTTLYSLFVEDIRHSVDGGLYSELLQNRALQGAVINGDPIFPWKATGSSKISIAHPAKPVSSALPKALNVTVPKGKTGGAGQYGYWGINVEAGHNFNLSFHVRSAVSTFKNAPLIATLKSHTTGEVLASRTVTLSSISPEWQRVETTLKPTVTPPTGLNNFSIHFDTSAAPFNAVPHATLLFALFSLEPQDTWNHDFNGHRADLAQAAIDFNAGGWRWPGGNNMEGNRIVTRWKWNETIGPQVERPGRPGTWGYWNTDGEGLMEMLRWTEQTGLERIMSAYAGYSLNHKHVNENNIDKYVQDAINFVQFVSGDASSNKYAKQRAALGHPEPFSLRYIEIGNEDFFDTTDSYVWRWKAFATGLQKAFPNLNIIASYRSPGNPQLLSPAPKFFDDHFYNVPSFFIDNAYLYDSYHRNGTKWSVLEYAVTSIDESCYGKNRCGRTDPHNMVAASAEAMFTLGLERNSDIIWATAYGITYQRAEASNGWTTDLVHFNSTSLAKSTAWHALRLYAGHRGDVLLQSTAPTNDSSGVIWTTALQQSTGKVFIKLANARPGAATLNFDLSGFTSVVGTGTAHLLSGDGANTLAHPNTVVPKESTFAIAASRFTYSLPAHSVAVLVVETGSSSKRRTVRDL